MASKEKTSGTLARILDNAENLFASQGFEGTSTRQIARAAGISIQTLHYHVENKNNLYLMVIRRAVAPMVDMIQRHVQRLEAGGGLDAKSLRRIIEDSIEDLFSLLHANPNYAHLYFRQYLEQNPDLMQVEFESYVPRFREWASMGEMLLTASGRQGPDVPLVLLSLAWMFHGLFVNSHFVGELLGVDQASPEFLDRLKAHAKTMTKILLGSLETASGPLNQTNS